MTFEEMVVFNNMLLELGFGFVTIGLMIGLVLWIVVIIKEMRESFK